MLSLERLGNITAELSTSLIQSIMLPGQWLGRLHHRARTATPERVEELERDYLPSGLAILTSSCPIPEDAVVATIRHAGTRKLRVAVVSLDAAGCTAESFRVFVRYGIHQIDVVQIRDRDEANALETVRRLEAADVAVLIGSDGLAGRDLLIGTAVHAALAGALEQGKVVIGAAGGGALLAERLVSRDPKGENTVVEPGLGLLPRLILPTGLDTRQGYNRLLHTMGGQLGAQFLGICGDPGSGVSIRGNEAWVLGEGSVTFLDGRESSLVPDAAPESRTCPTAADGTPVCGLRMHVLVADYGLNLRTRRPLAPAVRPTSRAAEG